MGVGGMSSGTEGRALTLSPLFPGYTQEHPDSTIEEQGTQRRKKQECFLSSQCVLTRCSSQWKTCQFSNVGCLSTDGCLTWRWMNHPVWKYQSLWSTVVSGCFSLPFMSNPTWQQSLVMPVQAQKWINA